MIRWRCARTDGRVWLLSMWRQRSRCATHGTLVCRVLGARNPALRAGSRSRGAQRAAAARRHLLDDGFRGGITLSGKTSEARRMWATLMGAASDGEADVARE